MDFTQLFNSIFNPVAATPAAGAALASNPEGLASALASSGIEPPGSNAMASPLSGLSGVKAPAAPAMQKIGTPGIPQPRPVQASPLVQQLVQAISGQVPQAPLRLGQIIGGR